MRKRERVEEEKRRAEEIKNSEHEAERMDELQLEKDEKYVTSIIRRHASRVFTLTLRLDSPFPLCTNSHTLNTIH